MSDSVDKSKICVVIGAGHAGVNFAFSLRREGWVGGIILYDTDPTMPYHRPPLSKTYLTNGDSIEKNFLKSAESYDKEGITLKLGITVSSINRKEKIIVLGDGTVQSYDKLVLATGTRPIMPTIPGITSANNVFSLCTAADVAHIRAALKDCLNIQVVVIGGGYIGLETAASLKKLGGIVKVTVLEREERILVRVTAPEISNFFQHLHAVNGVEVLTSKNVIAIQTNSKHQEVVCDDGTRYPANIIVVGVGVRVNTKLAESAGLAIENGIRVDPTAKTNDDDIYAIGDCTFHYNSRYKRFIRLECVQNAVDQAKVAAAAICGRQPIYDSIPWFWSDQYDVKLQIVGLSEGYDQILVRKEGVDDKCFSVWYFREDNLLAVDAVNNAKAYVYGTKFIKSGERIDKSKLIDLGMEFKPDNLLAK